jgi:hypothetical protein
MAFVIGNRIKVATGTTGTGTVTLSTTAEDGFQNFANGGIANSDVVRYTIEDGTDFEIGNGTYNSGTSTLTRTLLESSTGSLLNLSGDAIVFVTAAAEDLQLKDSSGNISVSGNITVTGTVDGRDVATDGTKLDGIETGATADQTKADIDALNINADQLDGSDGTYYLNYNNFTNTPTIPSAANNATISLSAGTGLSGGGSFTTNQSSADTITFNLEAPYTYIDTATGNYGTVKVDDDRGVLWAGYAIRDDWVFMSSGSSTCGIYNDTDNEWAIYITANGSVSLRYDNSNKVTTTSTGVTISGALSATGDVSAFSDYRLKSDIEPLSGSLDAVCKLQGVKYTRNSDGQKQIGFIAQDVKEVVPELVLITEEEDGLKDVHSMKYGNTVALLVEAIKEQQEIIEKLNVRLSTLEEKQDGTSN